MCVGVVASESATELDLAIVGLSGVLWEDFIDGRKYGLVDPLHLDKVIWAAAPIALLVHVEFRGWDDDFGNSIVRDLQMLV